MFKIPLNQRTMTIKLKRIEVCDLMLACTVLSDATEDAKKWDDLHEKLKKMIDKFDATQEF